jgi:hypothetical protein
MAGWHGSAIVQCKNNQRLIAIFSEARDSIAEQSIFIDQLIHKKAAPYLTDVTSAIKPGLETQ